MLITLVLSLAVHAAPPPAEKDVLLEALLSELERSKKGLKGEPDAPLYYLSLIILGLSLLSWGGPIIRFGMPWYLTLLFPVTAAVAVFVFIRSTVLSITGKLEWKWRPLIKHSFHL